MMGQRRVWLPELGSRLASNEVVKQSVDITKFFVASNSS
jgi:hypothetical protein